MNARKLQNPDIHKVDLVDQGANQGAKIMLFKRRNMSILSIFKKKPNRMVLFNENQLDLMAMHQEAIGDIMKSKGTPEEKSDLVFEANQELSDAVIKILFDEDEEIEKAGKKISGERLTRMKAMRDNLNNLISEADDGKEDEDTEKCKDKTKKSMEVNVDKSKMTPEDLQLAENLEKKYGPIEMIIAEGVDITKGRDAEIKTLQTTVETLQKRLDTEEIMVVAKKYEILGEDPAKLSETLLKMKKDSPEGYQSYVDSLEKSRVLVEKSNIFGEVGKSGHTGDPKKAAVTEIAKKASELMKSNPKLDFNEAKAMAWEQNPDLLASYEGGN